MKPSAILLAVFLSLSTLNAQAISNKKLLLKCKAVGIAKLLDQGTHYGCELDPNSVEVDEIDNRFYNPSAYIWFKSLQACGEHNGVTAMVQYYRGQCN